MAPGFLAAIEAGHYNGYEADFSASVIEEAGKFATEILEPLNQVGDREGIKLTDKGVVTAPGWPDAYKRWCDGGWNAVSGPEQWGGQGLPLAVHSAVNEIWSAANMSFGLCPLLTLSAIDALEAHGSEELKTIYLEKLISGVWPGTMQLTEPQAGTDVGALRTRAEKQPDGTYRLFGSKIFITYGDHDMSDNIVHFVLARMPGSSWVERHHVVSGAEISRQRRRLARRPQRHLRQRHRAQARHPRLADLHHDHGRQGWRGGLPRRRGERRHGRDVHHAMNQARLGVGLQGVGIADRAYQRALAYAQERKQGKARGGKGDGSDQIIMYPDAKRNLMLMRGLTAAARTICYATAVAIDISHRASDAKVRAKAAARSALLTPMAKAFSTDIGNEGLQLIGGWVRAAAWASWRKPAQRSTSAVIPASSPIHGKAPMACRKQ